MRKSQAMELTSVPIKVSVYARRPVERHGYRLGRRRYRAQHADVLLLWPRSSRPGV
jgi:hypothetical protein